MNLQKIEFSDCFFHLIKVDGFYSIVNKDNSYHFVLGKTRGDLYKKIDGVNSSTVVADLEIPRFNKKSVTVLGIGDIAVKSIFDKYHTVKDSIGDDTLVIQNYKESYFAKGKKCLDDVEDSMVNDFEYEESDELETVDLVKESKGFFDFFKF